MIINYACKSKEIWKRPCPVFIRSIAMEGGIGPVAGSSHHSLYFRMPGIKIASPMSPMEYQKVYNQFLKDDDVYYVSEHRGSFNNTIEFKNDIRGKKDLIIIAISITRFEAEKAKKKLELKGFKIGLIHAVWIKPFKMSKKEIDSIKSSKKGALILDDDYVDGIANSLANKINLQTNSKVETMGLKNKSAGFSKLADNLPPQKHEIIKKIEKIIKSK